MLALVGCTAAVVGALTAIENQHTVTVNGTFAAGTSQTRMRYLGTGRYVKLNSMESTGVLTGTNCLAGSSVTIEIGYGVVPEELNDIDCTVLSASGTGTRCENQDTVPETTTPGTTVNGVPVTTFSTPRTKCTQTRVRTPEDIRTGMMVPCVTTDVTRPLGEFDPVGSPFTATPATPVTPTPPTRDQPAYYKSHGRDNRRWFVRYTLNIPTGSTCDLELMFNARVKDPLDLKCFEDEDMTFQIAGGEEVTYSSELAAQPRHQYLRFKKETFDLPVNYTQQATFATRSVNQEWIDLGVGPQMDLRCLNIYSVPSARLAASDACRIAGTQGTDLMNPASGVRARLTETYDCDAFVDGRQGPTLAVGFLGNSEEQRRVYSGCCGQPDATACHQQIFVSEGVTQYACQWAKGICYPTFSMNSVDVSSIVGLNNEYSFASAAVHNPGSTYIMDEDLMAEGYQGVINRKWWLVLENTNPAGATDCSQTVTTTFISKSTGGLCEPSSRRLCDTTAATCMHVEDRRGSPIYWNKHLVRQDGGNGDDGADKVRAMKQYTTCNCLKQKETCYRKGGCISTKKYQLILQNCLEAGCGNYCNSGSALSLSLFALLASAIALFL